MKKESSKRVPKFYMSPVSGRVIKSTGRLYKQLVVDGFIIDKERCLYDIRSARRCLNRMLKMYPDIIYPSSNFIDIPKTYRKGPARAFIKTPQDEVRGTVSGIVDKEGNIQKIPPTSVPSDAPIAKDPKGLLPINLERAKEANEFVVAEVKKQVKEEPLSKDVSIIFNPMQKDFIPSNVVMSKSEQNKVIDEINQKLVPLELPPIDPVGNVAGIITDKIDEPKQIVGIVDTNNVVKKLDEPIKIDVGTEKKGPSLFNMISDNVSSIIKRVFPSGESLKAVTPKHVVQSKESDSEDAEGSTTTGTQTESTPQTSKGTLGVTTEKMPETETTTTLTAESTTATQTESTPQTSKGTLGITTEKMPETETTTQTLTAESTTQTESIPAMPAPAPAESTTATQTESIPEMPAPALAKSTTQTEPIPPMSAPTTAESTQTESTTVETTPATISTESTQNEATATQTEATVTQTEAEKIPQHVVDSIPSVIPMDPAALKKQLETAPEVKKEEVMEQIKCDSGQQFDVNEKRCMPCDFYGLVWDPVLNKCKIEDKKVVEEKKKRVKEAVNFLSSNYLMTPSKDSVAGYIDKKFLGL